MDRTTTHTEQIISQLRATHGDTIADTWHPMVAIAIRALHNGDTLDTPLVIDGKQTAIGGQVATILGVLDTIADTLGVEAISQNQTFDVKVTL